MEHDKCGDSNLGVNMILDPLSASSSTDCISLDLRVWRNSEKGTCKGGGRGSEVTGRIGARGSVPHV